jgi:hypothetical protein
VFAFIRRDGVRNAALMKNARAGFRRAQFRLWIFSYTFLPRSSKKRLSRLMIGDLYTRRAARLIRQERLDGAQRSRPQ